MRLYEITNTIGPEKFKPYQHKSGETFRQGGLDRLGAGMYATAFSSEQEPGTVRKISNPRTIDTIEKDAYLNYIKMISENDRFTSNPYFPKIYDVQVKKLTTKDDNARPWEMYVYAVDMERLQKYDSLSNEEALMLGEKMFNDFKGIAHDMIEKKTVEIDDGARLAFANPLPKDRGREKRNAYTWYTGVLVDFIHYAITGGSKHPSMTTTIYKDPELKKAVMLLRSLKSKADFKGITLFYDIHDENIMVRRGPGGPHLVFTDPLGG